MFWKDQQEFEKSCASRACCMNNIQDGAILAHHCRSDTRLTGRIHCNEDNVIKIFYLKRDENTWPDTIPRAFAKFNTLKQNVFKGADITLTLVISDSCTAYKTGRQMCIREWHRPVSTHYHSWGLTRAVSRPELYIDQDHTYTATWLLTK